MADPRQIRAELEARIALRGARISATRELSEKRAQKLYQAIEANERELHQLMTTDPEGPKSKQLMRYYDEVTKYYYQSDTYDTYTLKNEVLPGLYSLKEDAAADGTFTAEEIAPLLAIIDRAITKVRRRVGLTMRAFARVKRIASNDTVQSMVAGAAARSPLLGLALFAYRNRPGRKSNTEISQDLDEQRLNRMRNAVEVPGRPTSIPSAPDTTMPSERGPVDDDDIFDDDEDDEDDTPPVRRVPASSGGTFDHKGVTEMIDILNRHTAILESIYNINRAQHTAGLKRLKAEELAAEERDFEQRERGNPSVFASPLVSQQTHDAGSLGDLLKGSEGAVEGIGKTLGQLYGLKKLPEIIGSLKTIKTGGRGMLLTGVAAAMVAALIYKMMTGNGSSSDAPTSDTVTTPGPLQEYLGHTGTLLAAGEMFQKARGLFPVVSTIKGALAGGEGISTALKLGSKAGKRLPMAGIGFGAVAGGLRAMEGDYVGAGAELASGALGPLGLPIDAWLMARDLGYIDGPTTATRVPRNQALLDTVARGEVGTIDASGYDRTLAFGAYRPGGWKAEKERPLTKMTLREVYQLQSDILRNPQNRLNSSAVGRYQIVRATLFGASGTADRPAPGSLMSIAGLKPEDRFTPAVQDMLANILLERRGLKDVQSGKISSDQFQVNLAKEWASIATPTTGRSYYGQATGTSSAQIQSAIRASVTGDTNAKGRATVTQTLATGAPAAPPVVMSIATNNTNVANPVAINTSGGRGPLPSPTDSQPTVRGVLSR